MPRCFMASMGPTLPELLAAIEAPGTALSSSVKRIPWDARSDAAVKVTRRRTLGTNRARRAFEAALTLARTGVPVVEPLAWIENGGRAWFLARFVEGKMVDVLEDGEDAARLAARIHAAGVEHGDFKPQNLIATKTAVVVLDLDASKVHGAVPSRRARARDLGALVAYAERLGASAKARSRIVAAYIEAAPFEDDVASFERAVLARCKKKLARWAGA
jgi:tRNA A-37 threonylcarbamoyl transferase component Bud32